MMKTKTVVFLRFLYLPLAYKLTSGMHLGNMVFISMFCGLSSFHLISKHHWAIESCREAEGLFSSEPCAEANYNFRAVTTTSTANFDGHVPPYWIHPFLTSERARFTNNNARKRGKLQIQRGNT